MLDYKHGSTLFTLMALASFLTLNGLRILKSPGDGHCLLHSVRNSWSIQLPHLCPIDLEHIKANIYIETINNADDYLPFLQTSNRTSLFIGLRTYLINKHYNQFFGDIVPTIISNVYKVNLNIFSELPNNNYEKITVLPWIITHTSVDIHKTNDHYNGIAPLTTNFAYQDNHNINYTNSAGSVLSKHANIRIQYSSEQLKSWMLPLQPIKRNIRKILFQNKIWRPLSDRNNAAASSLTSAVSVGRLPTQGVSGGPPPTIPPVSVSGLPTQGVSGGPLPTSPPVYVGGCHGGVNLRHPSYISYVSNDPGGISVTTSVRQEQSKSPQTL